MGNAPEKKERAFARKTLKATGIAVAVVTVLIALAGEAVNFLLTNDQLQHLAARYAKKYLNADVTIENIDITFFSTFPRLGLRLANTTVVSHSLHTTDADTIWQRRDTLATAGELRAVMSLGHFMKTGEISIGRIDLSDAVIRMYADNKGRRNWDILKPDTITASAPDTLGLDTLSLVDMLTLKTVALNNVTFSYTDKVNDTRVSLKNVNLKADGNLSLNSLDADLEATDKSTSLKIGGTRYLRRLPLGLCGHIAYSPPTLNPDSATLRATPYTLDQFIILLGDYSLNLDGQIAQATLARDTTEVALDMYLALRLTTPHVEKLLELIPETVIDVPVEVNNGEIDFMATMRGRYSKTELPVMRLRAKLDNVNAHYEGMKQSMEDFTAKLIARIDDSVADSSYVNLKILHFKGGRSELTAHATVECLLDDDKRFVTADVDTAHLDLPSLLEVFPIKNLRMIGVADAKLKTKFLYKDIVEQNFTQMRIGGRITAPGIEITVVSSEDQNDGAVGGEADDGNLPASVPKDNIALQLEADLDAKFYGHDTIYASVKTNKLSLRHPALTLRASQVKTKAKLYKPRKDTLSLATIKVDAAMRTFLMRTDTLLFIGRGLATRTLLTHAADNKRLPHIESYVALDTLYSGIFGTRGFTAGLKSDAWLERTADSIWLSGIKLEVARLRARTPAFALPIEGRNLRARQGDRTITLDNLDLKAGNTSLSTSGELHNLYYSIAEKQPFRATINISADTIDANQILESVVRREERVKTNDLNAGMLAGEGDSARISMRADTTNATQLVKDTLASKLVYFSKRIDFTLNTDIKNLLVSTLNVQDIKGGMRIANRALHMTNLKFKHGTGWAFSTVAYKASRRRQQADINAFMRWERADISDIVAALKLDSMMPMLKPFKGKVDCYVAAQLSVDSLYNPDMRTLRASAHVGATRLTFLDSETFAKMSKIMMFKNKKENVMDTVSMNLLLDSSRITLLPFVAKLDRYRAVVGGTQDLFMSDMHYHVSVLKSPLPLIKAGLNIDGSIKDIKFDLTSAKLKKQDNAKAQAQNDTTSLKVRIDILKDTYRLSGLPLPDYLKDL